MAWARTGPIAPCTRAPRAAFLLVLGALRPRAFDQEQQRFSSRPVLPQITVITTQT